MSQANPFQRLSQAARMAAFQIGRRLPRRPRPVPGMRVERDVRVPMRDGVHLLANVFRPVDTGRYPVVASVSPYGKDELPNGDYQLFRVLGMDAGTFQTSDFAAFEAPDPGFWVPRGYVVVHGDIRGMWRSEGSATWLTERDAEDYYDLIEWAAVQPWSTGRVGLSGVSYLAMSQWAVAALRPPHLTAIMPWEGVSDQYREFAFHGGIPETGWVPTFWKRRFREHHNPAHPLGEDLLDEIERHPLDDAYWASKRPDLSRVTVPALVCTSWSDQGLHTRGSLEGFRRIGSERRWMYTHGRRKWETFYSPEAQALQQRFFDHFLRDVDNGMLEVPAVRLEVRRAFSEQDVRWEPEWPVPGTTTRRLFLDAGQGRLVDGPVAREASISYVATGPGRAVFTVRFDRDTEVTGGMRLRLWVAPDDADDADLFVGVEKANPAGDMAGFSGMFIRDEVVAKGWLRLSHREVDEDRSTDTRPWHPHQRLLPVAPGAAVAADVEILPSSTLFEAGSTLRLVVQGRELRDYPAFGHDRTVNRGRHRLLTGGRFDAALSLPVVVRPG